MHDSQFVKTSSLKISSLNLLFLKTLFLIVVIILATGIYQKPAHAHRLNVFCYIENGKVEVESYFQSGTACKDCKIQVLTDGVQVFSGKTDDKGYYSFGFKAKTTYKVIVDAGMGHRGDAVIKTQKGSVIIQKTVITNEQHVEKEQAASEDHEHSKHCLGADDIKKLISAEVDQKIAKLKNDILRSQRKEGVKAVDVIAGLGFIFGLCALILVSFRKKDKA